MLQLKTFSKRSGNFRQISDKFQRGVLKEMVGVAVEASPVDTAAFVDSYGFNGPQGFSSHDRPRQRPGPSTDIGAAKARNKARVQAEVDSLNLQGPVVFGNTAPHAPVVESLYRPIAQARREFTRIAREALQRTKGGEP